MNQPANHSAEQARSTGESERVPLTIPAQCLGELCDSFTKWNCQALFKLLEADGDSGGNGVPPRRGDASFALYGRYCMGGDEPRLIGLRTERFDVRTSIAQIIATGDKYGGTELSHQIIDEESEAVGNVVTIADSGPADAAER